MGRRARWAGRDRGAFTIIEVIVALAIILILAAVALPQVTGFLDQKRVEATAEQLTIVRDALYTPGNQSVAFFRTVGANAGRLSQLVIPITTSDPNSCNANFSTQNRNNWPNEGPYLNFTIDPVNGMATPLGLTNNTLQRVAGPPIALRINWTNTVALEHATNLDLLVDGVGAAGWNTGVVRWTPQLGTNGSVTLSYDVVTDASC